MLPITYTTHSTAHNTHTHTHTHTQVPALPRVVVIVTNRRVPIPDVLQEERFLIEPLALSGFYHVVVRYGYAWGGKCVW